jgi:chorismate dehydratase
MPLRLGRVRYINCEPVYYAIEHGLVPAECEVFDGTPAELNERLRAGELDVSVVSAMEAALRPERYLLLPDLAIACDGPVESVLLASRMPIPELDGQDVALTRHSLTSVYLVRLLLDKAYAVRPRFLEEGAAASPAARLMIGDEALTQGPSYPYRLDLGEGWKTLTGLPFVFAVWAVRREVWAGRADEVRRLHAALLASKTATRDHPEAMVTLAQLRTGLPAAACRRYLSERLSFELTPRHVEGLSTFLRLLADAGVLATQPSLEFVPS